MALGNWPIFNAAEDKRFYLTGFCRNNSAHLTSVSEFTFFKMTKKSETGDRPKAHQAQRRAARIIGLQVRALPGASLGLRHLLRTYSSAKILLVLLYGSTRVTRKASGNFGRYTSFPLLLDFTWRDMADSALNRHSEALGARTHQRLL